ncbi:MAG: hypothetical protein ACKODS_06040 [Methylophilaceae bacterium]
MKDRQKKYDPKQLEILALEAIDKHKLFFIEDVVSFLPCSRATFYNAGLDKLDSIKEAITKCKVEVKVQMRNKWFRSESPALQISLMKLIGTEEEAHRLNGSKQQTDIKVEEVKRVIKWGRLDRGN